MTTNNIILGAVYLRKEGQQAFPTVGHDRSGTAMPLSQCVPHSQREPMRNTSVDVDHKEVANNLSLGGGRHSHDRILVSKIQW